LTPVILSATSYSIGAALMNTELKVCAISCGMTNITNAIHSYLYPLEKKHSSFFKETFCIIAPYAILPCLGLQISLIHSLSLFAVADEINDSLTSIKKDPSRIWQLALSHILFVGLTFASANAAGIPLTIAQSYVVTDTIIFSILVAPRLISSIFSNLSFLFEETSDRVCELYKVFT
jgi:hypothetical protein